MTHPTHIHTTLHGKARAALYNSYFPLDILPQTLYAPIVHRRFFGRLSA